MSSRDLEINITTICDMQTSNENLEREYNAISEMLNLKTENEKYLANLESANEILLQREHRIHELEAMLHQYHQKSLYLEAKCDQQINQISLMRISARIDRILRAIIPNFIYSRTKPLLVRTRDFSLRLRRRVLYKRIETRNAPIVYNRKNKKHVDQKESPVAGVSVVIPVYNAGQDLPVLLSSLLNQSNIKHVEVIIVDSGSSDSSVAIAQSFGCNVIQIASSEFTHSSALNIGVADAKYENVLLMVQDALPTDTNWLYKLVTLKDELGVCALSCAQMPRANADHFAIYQINEINHYLGLNTPKSLLKLSIDNTNPQSFRLSVQWDNLACLYSKSKLLSMPFEGEYAIDINFGISALNDAPEEIAVTSEVKVIHSHARRPHYHLKRAYIDTEGLNGILTLFTLPLIDETVFIEQLKASVVQLVELLNDIDRSTQNGLSVSSSYRVDREICTEDLEVIEKLDNELGLFLKNVLAPFGLGGIFSDKGFVSDAGFQNGFIAARDMHATSHELAIFTVKYFSVFIGALLAQVNISSPEMNKITHSLNVGV